MIIYETKLYFYDIFIDFFVLFQLHGTQNSSKKYKKFKALERLLGWI